MVGMVKNTEHPKLTFSSPKKATNIPVTFKGESPPPPPSPTSEGPSLATRWCQGQRARITHSLLTIENFKNL